MHHMIAAAVMKINKDLRQVRSKRPVFHFGTLTSATPHIEKLEQHVHVRESAVYLQNGFIRTDHQPFPSLWKSLAITAAVCSAVDLDQLLVGTHPAASVAFRNEKLNSPTTLAATWARFCSKRAETS